MLGNRESFDEPTDGQTDTDTRIQVESLRYFRENDPEMFEKLREDLKGTSLWNRFQKEYG